MSTTQDTTTEFEAVRDEILAADIERFISKAEADFEAALEKFNERARTNAFEAMRWNGEPLLGADVARHAAGILAENSANSVAPARNHELVTEWLNGQVRAGVQGGPSGYMTTEAQRTRAGMALEMLSGFSGFSSMATSASYQAAFKLAPSTEVHQVQAQVNELAVMIDRARSDSRKAELAAQLEGMQLRLAQAKDRRVALGVSKGVPAELLA
jgi:hypothetical protein